MTPVLLTRAAGGTVYVNPDRVSKFEAIPANLLPPGVLAATTIIFEDDATEAVLGTPNFVAAALSTGAGGAGGAEVVFRPGAADQPSVGIYGSWASLVAAVAPLVAVAAPFVINVDFSVLGASFLVPSATSLGGRCTLRALPSAFALQITSVATLSGVIEIDGLKVEVPALGGATAALLTPVGLSFLTLRNGAVLVSNNAAGPVIDVAVTDTLALVMESRSAIAAGASPAVVVGGAGGTLVALLGDSCGIAFNALAGLAGSALQLVKSALSARLPAGLAGFVGYNNGGVATTALLAASGPAVQGGQFGAAALPLIFGAYFLEAGGNSAVALATPVDSPWRAPQDNGTPRLLAGVLVYADTDGTNGVNDSIVEVLVGGVLVPGMLATWLGGAAIDLATNPVQLTPTQGALVYNPGDVVSVRFTHGAAGIAVTPANVRAVMLVG